MVLRHQGDQNEERMAKTPPGNVIAENFERFMRCWSSNVINTFNCLPGGKRLKVFMISETISIGGCLSDVPPGEGTERNERLHDFLSSSLLCDAKALLLNLILQFWLTICMFGTVKDRPKDIPVIVVLCQLSLWSANKAWTYHFMNLVWNQIHSWQVALAAVGDVACLSREW